MKKIALVGYMGSGKGYWGQKIASRLNARFVDLDQILESDYLKMSISDFIESSGELNFRKLERQALINVLELEENIVLATGGGTPCYFNNMDLLNRSAITVFMNPSIKTLVSRLENQQELENRPLLKHVSKNDLQEFVAKHLFERRHFYSQAHIVINEEQMELDALIEALEGI